MRELTPEREKEIRQGLPYGDSAEEELLTEIDKLRYELDRITQGSWSREIARVNSIKMKYRNALESIIADFPDTRAAITAQNALDNR